MKALYSLAWLAVFLCVCCKGTEKKMEKIKEDLVSRSGSEVECEENDEGSYLLCRTMVDKTDPLKVDYHIKFVVVNKSNEEIIFKGSVLGGYVQWHGTSQIEYYSPPGIMPDGKGINDYIKVYDLDSKITRSKSKLNNREE